MTNSSATTIVNTDAGWDLLGMLIDEGNKVDQRNGKDDDAVMTTGRWRMKTGKKIPQREAKEAYRKQQVDGPPGLHNKFEALATEEEDEEREEEWSEERRKEWEKKVEEEEKVTLEQVRRKNKKQHAGLMCLFDDMGKERRKNATINNIEDTSTTIDMVIDSGASIPVIPRCVIPGYKVRPSKASLAGVEYTVANGDTIPNEGEVTVAVETEEGAIKGLQFQVANTTRPLISVDAITKRGNKVILEENGGHILNLTTGQTTRLRRINGVYVLRTRIVPSDIARQMGFPGQEA